MQSRYRRLGLVLFSASWLIWLVVKRFVSREAELLAILGLVSILLLSMIVFGVRQTRRDARRSAEDS